MVITVTGTRLPSFTANLAVFLLKLYSGKLVSVYRVRVAYGLEEEDIQENGGKRNKYYFTSNDT